MLEKRIVVRMDSNLRNKIKKNCMGRTLCAQYGDLLERGLNEADNIDLRELIEEEKVYKKPKKHLKVRVNNDTYKKVKEWCKQNNVRRPTAYAILMRKGLEKICD